MQCSCRHVVGGGQNFPNILFLLKIFLWSDGKSSECCGIGELQKISKNYFSPLC